MTMSGITHHELALARPYSEAMLEVAQEMGEVDLLFAELRDLLGQASRNPDFRHFLTDPLVDASARQQTLEKLFRGSFSDLFVNSLQILNRKGRLGLLMAVAESFRQAREELQGRIRVQVRTASALTDELRSKIRDAAKRQTGKDADLEETIDESLIGGLVVQIGDKKFDSSIATKLAKIGASFVERSSKELRGSRTHIEGAIG